MDLAPNKESTMALKDVWQVGHVLYMAGAVPFGFRKENLQEGTGPTNVGQDHDGRQSFLIVSVESIEMREEVEDDLMALGAAINPRYQPGLPVVQVRVKKFKSTHRYVQPHQKPGYHG
jgi:hypothetical protein